MRLRALAVVVAIVLIAVPVSAQSEMPPVGTIAVAIGISDGTTYLPLNVMLVPTEAVCGPLR